MRKWGLRLLRTLYVGLIACLPIAAFANYQAGQCSSSCLNFASTVVAGFHYAQLMLTDSLGADVSDTTNHAIKVNVVAGGAGGGIVTNAGTFAAQLTGATNNINNIAGTISLPTGAATSANQSTEITALNSIVTNTGAAIPPGTANIGNIGQISQYPTGATAITASATGTTGATTATLAGTGGKTTFMCWSSVRANATAATTVTDTITGVITGTLSRSLWVAPAASGIGVDEMVYNPCVPASAPNTGIAIVSGAPGTGGVVTVNGGGYQL